MNRLVVTAISSVFCLGLIAKVLSPVADSVGVEAPAKKLVGAHTATFADEPVPGEDTIIHRDPSGQFRINGRINGLNSKFLVDTGADVIALTLETAQDAGIAVDPGTFQPMLQTASGEGMGARYVVKDLEIAGRPFTDVEVIVAQGLETNL
ncbi:MAG: TIGR02281 family clan AA aspartic protease, partial [Novosphingobium sp.]